MFGFLKKTVDKNVYSPTNGNCVNLEEVNDKTFSSKLLGDGFAVLPSSERVVAPCDGTISMIFPTKHAFGVKMDDGKEILVHIGIDTVNRKGKGFTLHKSADEKVKKGDLIVSFDKEDIAKEYDTTVMVVVTEMNNDVITNCEANKEVNEKELIMTFE